MTVISDPRVNTSASASEATLDCLESLLERLVPSCEPAVVFTSLARLCIPAYGDRCAIEIVEDGGAAYVVDPTGVTADATADPRPPRGGGLVRMPFEGVAHGATAYRGTFVSAWSDRAETTLDTVLARILVARAVSLVAEERLLAQARQAHDAVANLRIALVSSRAIGNAVGILMVAYKITDAAAFEMLRDLSQRSNRKVADIAADVVETGCIDRG